MLNFARRRLRDGVLLLHEDLDLALRCLHVAVHVVGEVGDTERPGKEESSSQLHDARCVLLGRFAARPQSQGNLMSGMLLGRTFIPAS